MYKNRDQIRKNRLILVLNRYKQSNKFTPFSDFCSLKTNTHYLQYRQNLRVSY